MKCNNRRLRRPGVVREDEVLARAAGLGGDPAGDALIELQVRPHPLFQREGDDIRVMRPISLAEAVLGGKVEVPTPTGLVSGERPGAEPSWT